MKYIGKIYIVYDGMWGSCGKGKICGKIARDKNYDIKICVNNNAPNSGHTFVFDDGRKVITRHIPIGFVNKNIPYIVIGESAIIDPKILEREIEEYQDILGIRKIYICSSAGVIIPEYIEREKANVKSGSTFKGTGVALTEKVLRKSGLAKNNEILLRLQEEGKIKLVSSKTFFPCIYNGLGGFSGSENILVECSQGDALGLNGESYPFVTSRDCNPAQALKDIHATDYSQNVTKICVFRPYPIRINNQSELGYIYTGDFEGAEEINWQIVSERCGMSEELLKQNEMTTVTKRLRRVSEFSVKQFSEMLLDCKPDVCVLNFAEYVDYNISNITTSGVINGLSVNEQKAFERIVTYCKKMQDYFNNLLGGEFLRIINLGTGAKESEEIDLTKVEIKNLKQEKGFKDPFDFADKTNLPNLSF